MTKGEHIIIIIIIVVYHRRPGHCGEKINSHVAITAAAVCRIVRYIAIIIIWPLQQHICERHNTMGRHYSCVTAKTSSDNNN